jgi:hypothetical protein
MELNTLNFSKKPEEVKVLKSNVYPFRKDHIYIGRIIPTRVIKDRCVFEITYLDESLFIEGFTITTYLKEDQIRLVNLFGEHPNCDLNTNEFCWAKSKNGVVLDQRSLSTLLENLQTYYLDDAYFIPGENLLRYKKVKSISIQLNEGED